jgi:hypothetical protein
MPDISQNLDRVKPFYIVEAKLKTKYKRYLSNSLDTQSIFIHFKGVEIQEDTNIDSYEQAKSMLDDKEQIDKYIPWSNIVDVTVKRLIKGS